MRLAFLISIYCAFPLTSAAEEGQIVFPVPGREGAEFGAWMLDKIHLGDQASRHLGVDILAQPHDRVVSPVSGEIVLDNTGAYDPSNAFLVIRAEDTGFEHVLEPLRSDLKVGDALEAGDPIGEVALVWGRSETSYLHYGINRGSVSDAVDHGPGWGIERAPATATIEEVLEVGWMDPASLLREAALRPAPAPQPGTPAPEAANGIEGTGEPPPPDEIGAEIIVPASIVDQCSGNPDRPSLVACLETAGAPEQALAFVRGRPSDPPEIPVRYIELGPIDAIEVRVSGPGRARNFVLVNASGEAPPSVEHLFSGWPYNATVLYIWEYSPRATTAHGSSILAYHRYRADGAQVFVFRRDIRGGCPTCPIIGQHIVHQTFVDGKETGSLNVGWTPSLPLIKESLFKLDPMYYLFPLLGYEVGPEPKDGQSKAAWSERYDTLVKEFRAEHCLPPLKEGADKDFDRVFLAAFDSAAECKLTATGFRSSAPSFTKADAAPDPDPASVGPAPVQAAERYTIPAKDSPDWTKIMDATTQAMLRELGHPIEISPVEIRVAGDLAFVDMSARARGGHQIDPRTTPIYEAGNWIMGYGDIGRTKGFLRRRSGVWEVHDLQYDPIEAWWISDCPRLANLMPETCG